MVAGHAGEPAASSGGRAQARRARGEALVVGRAGAASARGGSSRTRVQPGRQRAQTRAHEPTASMAAAKQVNKTASTSTLFHRLNHVLESGRVSEICIEALVALTAAVLCFLIIFGSWRRWCTHWSTQKGLMVAYFMSFSLATYTVGLMQSAALKVEVYPIWAVCFLTIFGCSNSITAYSIDDHKQVFRRVSQDITYVVYLVLILYSVADGVSFIVPFVMLLITLVKVYHRTVASMTVASLRTRTRVIADYMDSKHETRVPYNPVSMTGCRYLVSLRPKGHAIFNRNSITAYSVDDHKQVFRRVSQYITYVVYLVLILYSVADGVSFIVLCVMLAITLVKVYQRTVASMTVASLRTRTRVIADYMDSEHETRAPYDPVSMTGYRYLVNLRPKGHAIFNREAPRYASSLDDFEVITIEKIWREGGGGGDDGPIGRDCKDVCLSYALFLLLTRRLFGYSCGESKQRKTHDLVFEGLLRGQMGYERAFKVIETELAFMYDLFFTKYATIGSRGMVFWALASVASMLFVIALTVMRATGIVPAGGRNGSRVLVAKATFADATITVLILAALALLEVLELVVYWTSIWGKVDFACQYVSPPALIGSGRKLSCSMRMKAFLTTVTLFSGSRHHWRRQLGQYSLLQSIGRGDPHVCVARTLNFCQRIFKIVGLQSGLFGVPPVSRKALDPVKSTADVKWSVALTLKRTDGRLTNGTSSLEHNGCSHLSWACSPGFCYPADSPRDREKDTQTPKKRTLRRSGCRSDVNIGVAIELSRYCAYLIVSAPQLLPGNEYDTFCLFDAAAREAVNVLKDAKYNALKDAGDKYEAMRNLDEPTKNIFNSGVKLGKQLEEIPDATLRWKVMADFWAEMMLYVAPSDNAKDHVEQLAQGGEFITHLWALLLHAGIVNRDNQHDTVAVELVDVDAGIVNWDNQHDTVVVELVDGDRRV